jgi:phosphoglucosamine mutase
VLTKYPQVLMNISVSKKKDIHKVPALISTIEKIKKKLGPAGRVLVRSSGTEPLIRIMVEGEDKKEIQKMAKDIARCVEMNFQQERT